SKLSTALVQVHLIGTEIRQVEIRQSIVVDIADGNAHPVASRDDATLLSYISEYELAGLNVVAEEPAARRLGTTPRKKRVAGLRIRFQNIALDQENIQVAIVIKIEKRSAAARDLGQVKLSRHAVVVLKLESDLFCYFFE